jgi:chromosome partitioning protein
MKSTAHIIVFGNEKGGSGKSTTAMHVAIGLLRLGYRVGTIDLDARQGTMTHYLANRFETIAAQRLDLPCPLHFPIEPSEGETIAEKNERDQDFLMMAIQELQFAADFIVIDTPGSETHLGELAHSWAGTLITPMNDSFVDMDVIARISGATGEIMGPSIYTRMVEKARQIKRDRDGEDIDWIVMRTRLSHIDARNKREVGTMLEKLGEKFGFRIAPGFGERVIFRELFLKGLTLLDLKEDSKDSPLTLSAISARQEVRHLLLAIGPEHIKGYPRHRKS